MVLPLQMVPPAPFQPTAAQHSLVMLRIAARPSCRSRSQLIRITTRRLLWRSLRARPDIGVLRASLTLPRRATPFLTTLPRYGRFNRIPASPNHFRPAVRRRPLMLALSRVPIRLLSLLIREPREVGLPFRSPTRKIWSIIRVHFRPPTWPASPGLPSGIMETITLPYQESSPICRSAPALFPRPSPHPRLCFSSDLSAWSLCSVSGKEQRDLCLEVVV